MGSCKTEDCQSLPPQKVTCSGRKVVQNLRFTRTSPPLRRPVLRRMERKATLTSQTASPERDEAAGNLYLSNPAQRCSSIMFNTLPLSQRGCCGDGCVPTAYPSLLLSARPALLSVSLLEGGGERRTCETSRRRKSPQREETALARNNDRAGARQI